MFNFLFEIEFLYFDKSFQFLKDLLFLILSTFGKLYLFKKPKLFFLVKAILPFFDK